MKLHTLGILTVAATLTVGCGKKKADGEAAGGGGGGGGGGGSVDKEQAKLQPYIECLNRHSQRAGQSHERYLSYVDAAKGPKEGDEPNLYELYDPKDCLAGIAAAQSKEPKLVELDAAGAAYGKALAALQPLTVEAAQYYDRKNYKDDKFAKGIELHPKLIAAFDAFDAANDALGSAVSHMNRAAHERALAAREKKEGRTMPVLVEHVMLSSEDVVEQTNVPWAKMPEVDVAKLAADIDALEKLIAEAGAYAKAHADEARDTSSVMREADDFLTAAKEFMRRIRDKQEWSSGDKMNLGGTGEWMVDGSPAKVMRAYNETVDAYNRM